MTIKRMLVFLLRRCNLDHAAVNMLLGAHHVAVKNGHVERNVIWKNPLLRGIMLWAVFIGVGGMVTMISRFAGGDEQTLIMVWVTVSTAAVTMYYTNARNGEKKA